MNNLNTKKGPWQNCFHNVFLKRCVECVSEYLRVVFELPLRSSMRCLAIGGLLGLGQYITLGIIIVAQVVNPFHTPVHLVSYWSI